jgi:hypothetical protein
MHCLQIREIFCDDGGAGGQCIDASPLCRRQPSFDVRLEGFHPWMLVRDRLQRVERAPDVPVAHVLHS